MRSRFIFRNSCLLNINPGVSKETFRQPLAVPYLAALTCLSNGCGSRQRKRDDPSSAAFILLNASHLSGSRDSLSKCTSIQSRLSTSCTSGAHFFLCKPVQSYLAAQEINAQDANITYPAFTQPLWSINWLVKLSFGGYTVSIQAPAHITVRGI